MTEMENPVTAARRKLGLSRHDVAIMGGVGTIYLYNAERGATTRVPDGIVRVFEQLGIDGNDLQAQYAASGNGGPAEDDRGEIGAGIRRKVAKNRYRKSYSACAAKH